MDEREHGIEPRILESLKAYEKDGRPPGGFLRSALENDLATTILRADPQNLADIRNIVGYLFDFMDAFAWGSADRVKAHLAKFNTRP